MKGFSVLAFSVLIQFCASQNLQKSCIFPDHIPESRLNRLHHPCESNQNREFAIETHDKFYCIYYSTITIGLFGAESKFEIKIDGEFDYEQKGAENFEIDNKTLKFSATMEDVRVIVKKRTEKMPQITSVIIEDGALAGDVVRQEYCSNEDCGFRDDAVSIILGGSTARVGSWPWNAAMYYKSSIINLQFRCGATIINKRTLITTATCLFTGGKQDKSS